MRTRFIFVWLTLALGSRVHGQEHQHTPGMRHDAPGAALPTSPGQAAFGAIGEVVAMLTADSATDWSKVDIEALRQHLITMDDVIMHARVAATPVEGGVRLLVTGTGSVTESIRRMVIAHGAALDATAEYRAQAAEAAGGASLVVTVENRLDQRAVARVRALGLAGLLTEGSHHMAHHLMIAKGADPHGHDQ